jgi:uncharacterized protein (DUF58 family)
MWRRRSAESPPAPPPRRDRETPDGLLRRLHWTILRPLARHLGGDERSLVRGPGIELAEVREYQPGDDVRHIDWKITARTDRPHVREAYAERALDAWLLLDVSASVDWGTTRCLKRDRAIELAGVAGSLLGRHGNRVGALLFAERPLVLVPPGSGRTHLLRVLAQVRDEPRQAAAGRTDLAAAVSRLRTLLRRRSFVLVVSDFLVPDGWQDGLGALAQRHEVVAVRLSDPREAELPDVGLVTFEDPETGSQLIVDTSDRKLRERFLRAAQGQVDRVDAHFAGRGIDRLILSTDEEILPPLVRFLNARRLRRGPTGGPRHGSAVRGGTAVV